MSMSDCSSDVCSSYLERRYSEDEQGRQVLRFSLSFTYAGEMFKPDSENGRIPGPEKQKATDSAQGVPTSLFSAEGSNRTEESRVVHACVSTCSYRRPPQHQKQSELLRKW